jgi:hypothetical protein
MRISITFPAARKLVPVKKYLRKSCASLALKVKVPDIVLNLFSELLSDWYRLSILV